ncbi:PREDICTED: sn1-specific diacylglycerol lipase beta isoform X2 [Ipomoea nil]|uniref:sn1-specific diacylglycerol lipase beta isoform X2 n=1 Tax=Ipomoea nil TaxID=35883 RepID=UPI0009018D63|nr:PREDICTED: sn1-specific diacylglycerol lipase beta isoform X2 [Ipomoea nil]
MAQIQIQIRRVRWSAWFLGASNGLIIVLGISVVMAAEASLPSCGRADIAAISAIALVSCARILQMIRTGVNQKASALTILSPNANSDPNIRQERRRRYRRWLWWSRFAAVITALQFLGAAYFLFILMKFIYQDGPPTSCVLELFLTGQKWQRNMVLLFITMVIYVAPVQCFTGSDVLKWRSFYATEDYAWKAHYREVFDHGIREALCCLGRFNYLTAMDEDEVYSVAEFLGDLVSYRVSGTGHLEFLAGLALLHRYSSSSKLCEEALPVPEERIHEAALFHPFAEAAYTGLLLDVGRNPILFPLSWLCRQGVFSPWARKSRPLLEGDNWWRGHAAAFLKYVKLTDDVLRKGRVNQDKCKAAYFIVVLHHLKTVVIAVRGTETPEDLITDGLCRECSLSEGDLDGLVNDNNVQLGIMDREASSLLHYAHAGVVEAARDLYMQVEGNSVDGGFLSSLLGSGCECSGYSLRIVGHSLGGAIAALLGIRLHRQFPNLHVYAYGPLPCVDLEVADACKEFITSVVYNDEFSARLSVGSIMRLQAAALKALSQDGIMDLTTLSKLSRQFMFLTVCQKNKDDPNLPDSLHESRRNSTWQEVGRAECSTNASASYATPSTGILYDDAFTQFMEAVPCPGSRSSLNLPEMFLPGLLVHIIPQNDGHDTPFWKRWRSWETNCTFKAYIANRESFRDFIVSPSIFLDHLPWRCHKALKELLRVQNSQFQHEGLQSVQSTGRTIS